MCAINRGAACGRTGEVVVRFRVLGPVEAYDGQTCISLGGAQPRLLLAAVLSEPDRVLPADRLIDILWGDDPPKPLGR